MASSRWPERRKKSRGGIAGPFRLAFVVGDEEADDRGPAGELLGRGKHAGCAGGVLHGDDGGGRGGSGANGESVGGGQERSEGSERADLRR